MSLLNEIAFETRLLRRSVFVTCAVALVMGMGVAAGVVVYDVAAMLLYPKLPVKQASTLRFLYGVRQSQPDYDGSLSLEDLRFVRELRSAFAGAAAHRTERMKIEIGSAAVPLEGESVSEDYFQLLALTPALGRPLQATDAVPSAPPAIVISDRLWRLHFGADPHILGRVVKLYPQGSHVGFYSPDVMTLAVVGVMNSEFRGTIGTWVSADFWFPVSKLNTPTVAKRPWMGFLIVRLAPGATEAHVRAALDMFQSGRGSSEETSRRVVIARQTPFVESAFKASRRLNTSLLFLGSLVVGSVIMFVAVTNASGLLFNRLAQRERDIAVRLALGATIASLARTVAIEMSLRTVLTCVVAVVCSVTALNVLHAYVRATAAGVGIEISTSPTVYFDQATFLIALVLSAAIGLCLGVVQWVRLSRVGLREALSAASPHSTRGRSRTTRVILICQITLCTGILLFAGGLVKRVVVAMFGRTGYSAANVVAIDIESPEPTKPSGLSAAIVDRANLTRRLIEVLSSRSDVAEVALTDRLPQFPSNTWIRLHPPSASGAEFRWAARVSVSPRFRAMFETPLLLGRDFEPTDWSNEPKTAIVSSRLADDLWPGLSPLGRAVALQRPDDTRPPSWLEVVGVFGDVTATSGEIAPTLYVPNPPYFATLLVRFRDPVTPQRLLSVQNQVAAVGDRLVVTRVRQVSAEIAAARYPTVMASIILFGTGGCGLALAMIGLYGSLAYSVTLRRREIGTRLALGARPRDIAYLILVDGVVVAGVGAVTGVALSKAIGTAFVSALVGVSLDTGAGTTVLALACVLFVGILASYLPSLRASRLSPSLTLRSE